MTILEVSPNGVAAHPTLADVANETHFDIVNAYHHISSDTGTETFQITVRAPTNASMPTLVTDLVAAAASAGLRTTAISPIDDTYLVVASDPAGQMHAEIRDFGVSTLTWTVFDR